MCDPEEPKPIADIVPHERRTRWLEGEPLRERLRHQSADPALQSTLDDLVGSTVDDI